MTNKIRTPLKEIACESDNMEVKKSLRVTKNFNEKCRALITWSKKHSSKQVVPITYTLEKKSFLKLLLLKDCESFIFRETIKIVVCFGLYQSTLGF